MSDTFKDKDLNEDWGRDEERKRDAPAPARTATPAPTLPHPAPPIPGLPPGAPPGLPQFRKLEEAHRRGEVPATPNQGIPLTGIAPEPAEKRPVEAVVASPHPQFIHPERPGLYATANYHEQEFVPIVGSISHKILSKEGHAINVHTPGVMLIKQPVTPR